MVCVLVNVECVHYHVRSVETVSNVIGFTQSSDPNPSVFQFDRFGTVFIVSNNNEFHNAIDVPKL